MQVKSGHANSKKPADSLKGRFTGVSIFSVAVFGTLAAKLWSMQILSSEDYANKAASNLYTTVSTPAPRGYIYDADGIALVKNRSSQTVLADADVVDDHDVVARLSAVLGIPQAIVRQRIQSTTAGAQSQRVVASDVRLRDVAFIAEHPMPSRASRWRRVRCAIIPSAPCAPTLWATRARRARTRFPMRRPTAISN